MRHRVREFKVGRKPAHAKAMLANQVSSLILEGRIQTTITKAKETRRLAEKMITLGKKGTLHARRRAISKLGNREAVRTLFADVAPTFMDRDGGYTRIIRLGFRRGDAAEMCYLELVQEAVSKKTKAKKADKEPVEETPEADAPEVIESDVAEETEAAAEETESKEDVEAEAVAEETEAVAEETESKEDAEAEAVAEETSEEETSEDSAEEVKEEKAE